MKFKKFISIAVTLIMAFSLAACGGNTTNESSDEPAKEKVKEDVSTTVTIFSYDLNKEDGVVKDKVKIDELNGENVFSAMKEKVPIIKDVKLNSFEIKEVDGVNTGFIDLSSNFTKASSNQYEQTLLIPSLVFTYLYNFDIEQVSIAIDGDAYSTDTMYISPDDYLDIDFNIEDFMYEEEEEEEPEEEYTDPGPGDPGDTEDYYSDPGPGDPGDTEDYYDYDDEVGCGDET